MKHRRALLLTLVVMLTPHAGAAQQWQQGPPSNRILLRTSPAMTYDAFKGEVVLVAGDWELNDSHFYDGSRFRPASLVEGLPSGITEHAMAYDRARHRVVMFGGDALGTTTWELDGMTWVPSSAPPLPWRERHAMAYDDLREVVVMYGGIGATGYDETWEYDGNSWQPGPPGPSGLGERSDHAMAYDSWRAVTVLYGGGASPCSTECDDTWEYDGTTWSQSPVTGPRGRLGHAMAFDRVRGVTVMFGGYVGCGACLDTWEYDGSSWTNASGPVPEMDPDLVAMAFDERRGRIVLFDAFGYLASEQQIWEYDGATWVEGPELSLLGSRYAHAAAYDSHREVVVLHGGATDSTVDLVGRDVWEYDGLVWAKGVVPPVPLDGRRSHRMAFDSVRQRVVVFGGRNGGTFPVDTFEYDGSAWYWGPAAPAALVGRANPGLAYDSIRAVAVLYGGLGLSMALSDTWEYDGTAWAPSVSAPLAMGPRHEHGMTFDAGRGVVVVFGGWDAVSRRNDTWEFDGTTWTMGAGAPAGLTPRASVGMAWDPGRNLTVLATGVDDGIGYRDDAWEYDGSSWTAGAIPPGSFAPRHEPIFVEDGVVGGLTLHSGGNSTALNPKGTWEYVCLSLAPGLLADAMLGQSYLDTIAASGGAAPYVYDVSAGTLPPGLSLASDGTLSGTPTSSGGWLFRVRAVDGSGCGGSQRYFLEVQGCGGISVAPGSLPAGTVGTSYSTTLSASGGTAPYTFAVTVGSLPPGLTLSPDGLLSGTPAASGSWAFKVTVTGSLGCTGAAVFALDVCPVVTVQPPTLPAGQVGSSYSAALSAGGGTAPYTYAVTAGSLPPGLVLSSDGRVSGTPISAGSWTFEVAATDSLGCSGSRSYDLWICPVVSVNPPFLPDGLVASPYSATLTAAGGTAPYTYAVTSGTLPPGMSLSPGGLLSGTPTTAGSWALEVTATDSLGCTGARSYTLQICPVVSVLPSSLPDGLVGRAYAATFTASGGTAPYTYALTSGALPPGLTLSVGGVLSGTPTSPGSFSFEVTTTDSLGCTGARTYVLRICPVITLSPATLPEAMVGVTYCESITASGGTPPYTYAVVAGSLPPWASSILCGTPNVEGSYGFTVRATDASGCTGEHVYTLVVTPAVDPVMGQGLGPPNPNRVRLFQPSGAPTPVDFYAYAAGQWGVNVAAGELRGDEYAEIVTGPGPGAVYGPQVRGFLRDGIPMNKVNYYAYGTLKYGVNVASGDLESDGFGEILSGAGPGEVFGPHVRGWQVDGGSLSTIAKINFFAYSTLKYGVNVGTADLDGDDHAELATGPGPGAVFGATVRGWNYDGTALTSIQKVLFNAYNLSHGVLVAGGDVEPDGYDELATAPGAGPANPVWMRGFDIDGGAVQALTGYDETPFSTLYGGRVGLAIVGADLAAELLAGSGPDPTAVSTVKAYEYDGASLILMPASYTPFPAGYGVTVTAGVFGY